MGAAYGADAHHSPSIRRAGAARSAVGHLRTSGSVGEWWTSAPYRVGMIAYFWERDDAAAVASRLGGEVRRGRFHGEDDDEDHPWVLELQDVDRGALDRLLGEYDGWLEVEVDDGPSAPAPLPQEPKRFKR